MAWFSKHVDDEAADYGAAIEHGIMPPAPPEDVSIVAITAQKLNASRVGFESQIDVLTAQIKRDIEKRRQLIASMQAVTLGLSALASDPSLTPEQAQQADREITTLDIADIVIEP